MASLTIRHLDDAVKAKLRVRAASHGRSMEEEAREILTAGVKTESDKAVRFGQSLRHYAEPFGGIDLDLPERTPPRHPPDFE